MEGGFVQSMKTLAKAGNPIPKNLRDGFPSSDIGTAEKLPA
jgi:hypothetical protein